MRKYILRVSLFLIFPLLGLIGFYTLGNLENIPAKRVTNSYSFNEKLKWLPKVESVDVLAIGSSMTLSNLSSEEIVNCFDTSNYLNLSSWGIRMINLESTIDLFIKQYNPKVIICASNVEDFYDSDITYDPENIKEALHSSMSPGISELLTNGYYFKHTLKNRKNYHLNTIYNSLMFDEHGGVPLIAKNFQIIPSRWEKTFSFDQIDENNYDQLAKISRLLRKKNIKFIFVQTPVREFVKRSDYNNHITTHLKRVEDILVSEDHVFLNFEREVFEDKFFVDFSHLNENGARHFTTKICTQLSTKDFAYE